MKKILFIVGSTRKNSFNLQLAKEVQQMLEAKAEVTYLDFSDVPFFNQDTEFPTPQAVERVRKEVSEAKGVWIFTPEYNQSYPGYLKNLLDWLSRPLKPNDFSSGTTAKNVKVTISGVSGKSAAGNSRKKLSELLQYIGMDLCDAEGTGLALDGKSFMTDKLTVSPHDKIRLETQINDFLQFIAGLSVTPFP